MTRRDMIDIMITAISTVIIGTICGLVLLACLAAYPSGRFMAVTAYPYDAASARRTPQGVRYLAMPKDDTPALRAALDGQTAALERCLAAANPAWVVRRDWFVVMVPADWYTSKCSGQQLVPSVPDCRLCIDQKGLPLPEKCCGLRRPTAECPCVCNMRAVIQPGNPPAIVTAPNLKLYRAELARLVTGVNFPWGNPKILECIK